MKRPSKWIICSVVAAAVAFCDGPGLWLIFAGPNDIPDPLNVSVSIWLGWIWIGTFVAALFFRGWRALWLLLAAPLALFWPAIWIFVGHACDLLGRCS